MATLNIIFTDEPYISEYAEMGYKIARASLVEQHTVKFIMDERNRTFIF
jgi:sulfur relay (sulfurtransferase) complex TusBCD TusD component (DsrE family)